MTMQMGTYVEIIIVNNLNSWREENTNTNVMFLRKYWAVWYAELAVLFYLFDVEVYCNRPEHERCFSVHYWIQFLED